MEKLKIIECSRDAMQGWAHQISTEQKVRYVNQLLKVGFDTIDFASFVSHKLIPQMSDSHAVADQINITGHESKLLAIVLNKRGAEEALQHQNIHYLGFAYSVSPTFQKRNANNSPEGSFEDIQYIYELCKKAGKELVVYLSMAFGNPYGDSYSDKIVAHAAEKISAIGVNILSLSDTVGLASATQIEKLVKNIIRLFPEKEIGVHLHSRMENWKDKLNAAHDNGCYRFDGAINGYGGCPMAEDELIGNMNTGLMVRYFLQKGYKMNINLDELKIAEQMASEIFL